MRIHKFNNFTYAFQYFVKEIDEKGRNIDCRNGNTKEISNVSFTINNPQNRLIIIPFRNNNIFATIAETLWVFSGRNDISFISRYLPRAINFSDDGVTWRGGYGPRLRKWHKSVDQIKNVYRILKNNVRSRRAVISLFDPELDYKKSKDIPCNNWLHFFIRDSRLSLNIAVRSNDLFWGFSGIDSFEWSFLLELLSNSLNVNVGEINYFISSLHIYDRHKSKSRKINALKNFVSCYDYAFSSPKFLCTTEDIDKNIEICLMIEDTLRKSKGDYFSDFSSVSDPYLNICMKLLAVYNLYLNEGHSKELFKLINALPQSDLRLATIEYFSRKVGDLTNIDLSEKEIKFFKCFPIH
jgi:thymidylate synthase